MSAIVRCPHCQKALRVADGDPTRKVKCPGCAAIFALTSGVPADAPAPPRTAAGPSRSVTAAPEEAPPPAGRRRPRDEDERDGPPNRDFDFGEEGPRRPASRYYPASWPLVSIGLLVHFLTVIASFATTPIGFVANLTGFWPAMLVAGLLNLAVAAAWFAALCLDLAAPRKHNARGVARVALVSTSAFVLAVLFGYALIFTLMFHAPWGLTLVGMILFGITALVLLLVAHFSHLLYLKRLCDCLRAGGLAVGMGRLIMVTIWWIVGSFVGYVLLILLFYLLMSSGNLLFAFNIVTILYVLFFVAVGGAGLGLMVWYLINVFRIRQRVKERHGRDRREEWD